jgi:formylglycine-generating enzyme required for sulfatase activity
MRTAFLLSAVVCILAAGAAGDREPMLLVPPGSFIMGDGVSYCGRSQREITLTRAFLLDEHEVTNRQYREMVQWAYDHGHVTATATEVLDALDGTGVQLVYLEDENCEITFDSETGTFGLRESSSHHAQGAYPGGYDPIDHPVKDVTWYGSARYCDWQSLRAGLPRAYEHTGDWACNGGDPYGAAGFRLPTDAEWEFAAQYEDERIYPWGDDDPTCDRANFRDPPPDTICVDWTTPVCTYPSAPELLGLFEMAGNMWEWCNDWWICDLGTLPETDPVGPPQIIPCRVVHGGSWYDGKYMLGCSSRFGVTPQSRGHCIGFRTARTAEASHTEGETGFRGPSIFLGSAQPNPFTTSTQITYALRNPTSGSPVRVVVHDVTGRLVRTLVNVSQPAGSYTVSWDGADDAGQPVAAGVYLYQLCTDGKAVTGQLLRLQ